MTKLVKSDKIRSEIQECIPVGCVLPAAVAVRGWRGGLHQVTVMAFWCGGLVMAFCPSPQKAHTRRPPSIRRPPNQKAITEGNIPPGADPPGPGPPQEQTPPRDQAPPPETCCKACWDITCNACWDSTPLWTESQTPVKTLPCPNFVAGGNKAVQRWLKTYASNQLRRRPLSSIWPRHHTQCRGRHAEYRRRSSVLCRTEFLKSSKHMRRSM